MPIHAPTPKHTTPITAAVAISPGYRLPGAWGRCHPLYDKIITKKVQDHFLQPNTDVLKTIPNGETGPVISGSSSAFVSGLNAETVAEFVQTTYRFTGVNTYADFTA
jgi:hypothetical protein